MLLTVEGLFLKACNDTLDGVLEVPELHLSLVLTGGNESGFVTGIGNVSAREHGREGGQALSKVGRVGGEGEGLEMHLKDLLAPNNIGRVDSDLAVKSAGAQ